MAGGRKTKLNPERQANIIKIILLGGSYKAAARAGHITETTLYEWLSKGDAGKDTYREFSVSFRKAYADAEASLFANVRQAARGTGPYEDRADWHASAWILERSRGYTRSGAQALRPRTPKPRGESPEQEHVRELTDMLEGARDLGAGPDKTFPIYQALREARAALGNQDTGPLTRDEMVKELQAVPVEILAEALKAAEEVK